MTRTGRVNYQVVQTKQLKIQVLDYHLALIKKGFRFREFFLQTYVQVHSLKDHKFFDFYCKVGMATPPPSYLPPLLHLPQEVAAHQLPVAMKPNKYYNYFIIGMINLLG